jgi:CheY-like chemotaxis protein
MASCKGLGGECGAPATHVLAVDDSSVDRAVIASILRSSKFRGELLIRPLSTSSKYFVLFSLVFLGLNLSCVQCAVTAVDSGKRALELLGVVRVL